MSRISCISGDVLPVCRCVPCARCRSCGTCAANVMSCAYIALCPHLQPFCAKRRCCRVSVPHRLCPSLSSIRVPLVAMLISPSSQSCVTECSPTPSTQSTVLDSCDENFSAEDLWEALRLPGEMMIEGSAASPRLEPARQRQRLDRAGAGRPAPRALEADLVDAEEAEPDARSEDTEPVLPSTQDGEDAAPLDAQPDPESVEYRKIYNKFLTAYRRWAITQTSGLEGRALV